MPRKRQTGIRKKKVWKRELKGTWSRKAHRQIKVEKIINKNRIEESI